MLVKVLFYRDAAKAYGGREYTYRTELPLKRGDRVSVPTAEDSEKKKAMVTEINVPESEIADYADRVLNITEFWEANI